MSSLTVEEDQKWLPTHVQVTVMRGRGLRGKGKHGTSDVYTIIQLGKEKYSTGVVEKTTEPEWREECSFELQPGVLESGGRCDYPSGSNELVLTVMHRALIGPDVFLGQAVIHLDKLFHETRCVKNEWYRLNSKTGKKEKERGDIQVTVQFTRNNLTASMYDLVMKDKSASTFTKLKERMRGKRRSSDEDSSSAVLPGGYGSLYRMRHRLPSDGGGEEDYEDDEGGEVRRSKMRTFFLRGKLRKSSDTRSSTSLGSESSESSSRGGSLSPTAGISVVVSDLSNSPSNSSNLTADNSPEHTANTSPKSSSLQCEFGDEAGEITIAVPQHTVCVNGSHAYDVQPLDPGSGKPVDSLGLGLLQKSLPLSMSLQNLSPHTSSSTLPKGPVGDGRRWSFDKPGEEEKAAIAAALEKSGPMLPDEEEQLGQAVLHKEAASSSSSSTAELESQGKKQRRNLFSHGRSESAGKGQSQAKDESEHAPAATEEKHRGWFGSKDSHSKPSSRPPISQLFPTNPQDSVAGTDPKSKVMAKVEKRPLPPLPTEGEKPLNKKSANPFTAAGELDSEWDESFEAFAAGRLQSPEDLTTDCKTQQNTPSDHPLERCNNKGALLPITDADQNTNVNEVLHHQPCTEFVFEAHKAIHQVANTNTYHFDTFAQFLETIPEHTSFESENLTLNTPDNSPKLAVCTETNEANTTTNTADLTNTSLHPILCHASSVKAVSSSPDPSSSGLGSSAEEDFLSCISSYSDKFSASSSSEEAEAQNLESSILSFGKSSESAVLKPLKPSESEDDIADRSGDLSLVEVAQKTIIQDMDGNTTKDMIGLDRLLEPHSPVTANQTEREDSEASKFPEQKSNITLQSDNENIEKLFSDLNEDVPNLLHDPPDLLHIKTSMTPDQDLRSTQPTVHIITSSPALSSSDPTIESTSSEGRDANQRSPIPFGLLGDLLNTSSIAPSPSKSFDETLLHTPMSNNSSGSFLQSLYVSTDSQAYQTCMSGPSPKNSSRSETNETLDSLNLTLCGELNESQVTVGGFSVLQRESTNACKPTCKEMSQQRQSREGISQGNEAQEEISQEKDRFGRDFSHKNQPLGEISQDNQKNQSLEEETSQRNPSSKEILQENQSIEEIIHYREEIRHSNQSKGESSQENQYREETCQKKQSSKEIPQENQSYRETIQYGKEICHLTQSRGQTTMRDQSKEEIIQENQSMVQISQDNQYREQICQMNQPIGSHISQQNQSGESQISQKGSSGKEISQGDQSRKEISQNIQFSGEIYQLDQSREETSKKIQSREEICQKNQPRGEEISQHFQCSKEICQRNHSRGQENSHKNQSGKEINQKNQSIEEIGQQTLFGEAICQLDQSRGETNQKNHDDGEICQKNRSPSEEFFQEDQFYKSFPTTLDKTATHNSTFTMRDDFGLDVFPAICTDCNISNNLRQHTVEGGESQQVIFADAFLNCPQAQGATLHRSHSEGTLTPAFEELLLPSFGSDPGAIQDSSSSRSSPELPSLTSFPPSLTPERSISPVAFSSLPFLADAAASSPPSAARGAAQEPLLQGTNQQQQAGDLEENSPHPVKPLTTAMLTEEKRTESRSVLEKLKSTIHPGRSSQISEQEMERKKSLTEGAGSYYHLTHSELVALLVQREAELERQKAEYERQKILLAKREVELKKLKPQVRDLEDYIDTLLVRIMEQKPTLLQVRSKLK
ncbi:uncharacterized protein rab11fip5a isoform X2 [Cheilinus undulatus]|uniref:uncharacterized protein rab11fip5a isoform X2 n=1 Tax=Cheilinus undulatus TaxID=241271 RepID=UPI001BD256E3|nr:uncharacterized protein rab11fip5a isoform X2 [Cheilinus undulatus]